jgi:hypothetical protein
MEINLYENTGKYSIVSLDAVVKWKAVFGFS